MVDYRGRFAPSPTGPLHFGSLVAALGSCLEALVHGGSWMVRLEDIDRPREAPGAADAILRQLEAHGFKWDGPVMRQSQRDPAYQRALETLQRQGASYPCACTRKEIADSSVRFASARASGGARQATPSSSCLVTVAEEPAAPERESIYPGTCRNGLPPGKSARSLRLRVPDENLQFDDAVQGTMREDLARQHGDFVIRRADGLIAYQLAVVVDDAEQRITDVVRGADLLGSTARQILLQRLLGLPTPRYAHLPAAVDARGEKLSKQTLAMPIGNVRPAETIVAALEFLGQQPAAGLARARIPEVWRWAAENWSLNKVPRARSKFAGFRQ